MAKPEQCSNCSKPATIHLTQIINNQIHKVDLCEDCPHKKSVTDSEAFSLADFLLKPQMDSTREHSSCDHCGFTPADFKKTGRFGCPKCYDSFKGMLRPMLSGMHKGLEHAGKSPDQVIARCAARNELNTVRDALGQAIRDGNYEEAAKLRDQLRQIEENAPANQD